MYFELYRNGNLIQRGKDILGGLSFSSSLMEVPSCRVRLPITYHEYVTGRAEIKIFVNGKCFYGKVKKVDEDKASETITLNIEHVLSEWEYRQISVNNAIKDKKVNVIYKGSELKTVGDVTVSANPFNLLVDEVAGFTDTQYIERAAAIAWKPNGERLEVTVDHSAVQAATGSYDVVFKSGAASVKVSASVVDEDKEGESSDADPSVIDELSDIYADTNFAYPGWRINFSTKAKNTNIDYVYSRQNKLEALNKTIELTDDLWWRVPFVPEKVLEISEFGEQKEWIISVKPSGENNVRLLEEPVITHDFSKVINLATVYAEKSDTGMSSMTLREVYNDKSLQLDGFPCVILRSNVNNERDYRKYSMKLTALAPNNELEYAIIDEESVALEDGELIEGTYAFNDLAPFAPDNEDGETQEITDADRIEAAKTAYHAAVRKLKDARRSYSLTLTTEEFPADVLPGDKVRFIYKNSLYILDSCSPYEKEILSYDDWFYVTSIDYDIGENGVETNQIRLEKYLRIERETANE